MSQHHHHHHQYHQHSLGLIALALAAALSSAPSLSWAQSASAPEGPPTAVVIDATRLIGRWASASAAPGGQTLLAEVELSDHQRFRGRISLDGRPLLSYTGLWASEGRQIQWHYISSTPPTPGQARVDKDEITSFDGKTLVLTSASSGLPSVFNRVAD